MKVLIIGANGFLGENLTYFLSEIDEVTLSLYDIRLNNSLKNLCDHYVEDDLLNAELHSLLIIDQDYIINLAGISGAVSSFEKIDLFNQINVLGLVKILEVIRKGNSKSKIIFPSSRLVYDDHLPSPISEVDMVAPSTIYGVNKLACEGYLKSYYKMYGIEYVILRISIPYGLHSGFNPNHGVVNNFLKKSLNNEEIQIFGTGEQQRDIIYIKDFLHIIYAILKNFNSLKNEVFNLGGTEVHSIKDIADKIVAFFNMGLVNTVDWPEDYKKVETGSAFLNSNKLFKALEFQPQFNLEQGLLDLKKSLDER